MELCTTDVANKYIYTRNTKWAGYSNVLFSYAWAMGLDKSGQLLLREEDPHAEDVSKYRAERSGLI